MYRKLSCIYIYMCVCIPCISYNIYIYMYECIYIYVCTHMTIHVYIYIYRYFSKWAVLEIIRQLLSFHHFEEYLYDAFGLSYYHRVPDRTPDPETAAPKSFQDIPASPGHGNPRTQVCVLYMYTIKETS